MTSAQAIDNLNALDSEPQIKKANNHTWVYILILCVLVAVVVALVVFASNVMKKNEEAVTDATRRVAQHPESPAESADTNALREKFAATLTSKNDEIRSLSKKLEDVNAQNFSLKSKLEAVTAESASLRCRVNEYLRKIAEMEAKMSAAEQAHAAAAAAVAQAQATALKHLNTGDCRSSATRAHATRTGNTGCGTSSAEGGFNSAHNIPREG